MLCYNWYDCEKAKNSKRESHNEGVLFLYTTKISQAPFFTHFYPWDSRPEVTLHNGTYTQSDWYSRREQKRAV